MRSDLLFASLLSSVYITKSKGSNIAHVIIIVKSEVSTFPVVIIIFRGYVPEMFVTS